MIVVLARLAIHPTLTQQFLDTAGQLVLASRQEPGCLGYELLSEGEGRYAFLERYRDPEAAQAHRKTDHFRTLGRAMGPFIDGPLQVIQLSGIDERAEAGA
ncbi:putative quinol monooxygenase [Cupriavidus lacunae]|uniref:Antibiotic biosynthesis monooxygenase n=1 Tax=Cupriavidus lacunae TaxID=2666307 RepID=A0A370P0R2_9BURK|nr:putative quinol monooxygenase [Cupriavidus lacunae]RDK11460.1 antibiotic biosynthesis monooxygenase [Cupriavidus lacunae]